MPPVTVQCTRDGYFILVVARDATEPSIDFDTLNLIGQGEGCSQEASNLYFSIFHFPVTACGTEVLVRPQHGPISQRVYTALKDCDVFKTFCRTIAVPLSIGTV